MNSNLLDPKLLITIGAFVAVMGGFYFTTSFRIEKLEERVDKYENLNENVIRLEEQMKIIQKQNDEIYKILVHFNND